MKENVVFPLLKTVYSNDDKTNFFLLSIDKVKKTRF